MATRTISDVGGNYNSTGSWVEGAVPTSSDDVVATATSGNLTITATAACKSVDLTGYVGVLTHNSFNWSIGTTGGGGTVKFVAGMTYTTTTSSSCKITLVNTSSTANITSAGKSFRNLIVNGSGCACVFQDTLKVLTALTLSSGSIDFNNQNATVTSLTFNSGAATLGSGLFSCSNFIIGAGDIGQVDPGTSTVTLTGGSLIQLGGNGLYNIVINSSTLSIVDDISYTHHLTINAPCVITMFAGAGELDLLAPSTVSFNSSGGNIIEFKSSSSGTQTSIVGDGSSTYNFNWLKLTDNAASSGTFNALNSTDGGNNTGWTISIPKTSQSSGVISTAYLGTANHQSTGGLSGGLSSANVQSTGDLT